MRTVQTELQDSCVAPLRRTKPSSLLAPDCNHRSKKWRPQDRPAIPALHPEHSASVARTRIVEWAHVLIGEPGSSSPERALMQPCFGISGAGADRIECRKA